jgi:hypothetical protein
MGQRYDDGHWATRSTINHVEFGCTPPVFYLNGDCFDVVINVDSMTEMRREDAERYLFDVIRGSKSFLSINHEQNSFSVSELPSAVCPPIFPSRKRPSDAKRIF